MPCFFLCTGIPPIPYQIFAIIGEKEIIQAAGLESMQRIRETEENDFYFEFFKRIERNKKSVFLLGDTQ